MTVRVLVSGSGKMGRQVLETACLQSDMEPVGVVDLFASADYVPLPDGSGDIPFGRDAAQIIALTKPDVAVDFTNAEWTPILTRAALDAGLRLVIGTTGLPDAFVDELRAECARRRIGAVMAPNFTLGAVLMQHMSKIAAPFFDYAEIIELHHEGKVDAPSGTSIATARALLEGRGKAFTRPAAQKETVPGTRGGEIEGITMHSVRTPGHVAHQEVILGGPGETLRIRHDSTGRESYMPGVLLAVRHAMRHPGLVVGLDRLIGLK